MKNIQVSVLSEAHSCPGGMMMFLAKLTQRGHQIKNMDDLKQLYEDSIGRHKTAKQVVKMPHGTIKRFAPITVAVVGASRRFLAQARTHHVGIDFVSASLQYSDYSGDAQFVVPYELTELGSSYEQAYLDSCAASMKQYKAFVDDGISNDTAGYMAPQGLRNILIIQGNHDAWLNFIRLRACNRNTKETQYVTLKIWEALLKTADGEEMFAWAGPDCLHGKCREGKMSCGKPIFNEGPTSIINKYFPLIAGRPAGSLSRQKGGDKMMKVIRMVTTHGLAPVSESYKMKQLYAAAGSVFALPDYEQVLSFLNGGPEPETPHCVIDTPGGLYAVGRMKDATGMPSVRIITDGGREVVVEKDRVTVNFRTGLRSASTEAAREVLAYLHQHTIDEICFIEMGDGRFISDADITPEEF